MFSPPRMTMSFSRPTMFTYPSSRMAARSPVCIQRAESMARAVASGHGCARARIDDLALDVGMNGSNRGDARFERIIRRGLKGNRRGFRHPVADRHLGHVHALRHLAHHVNRTWRARHDTGSERVDAVLRKRWMF